MPISEMLASYWQIAIPSLLLLGLSIDFLFRFLIPATRLKSELERTIDALRRAKVKLGTEGVGLSALVAEAMVNQTLVHAWAEYFDTVHQQKEADSLGQMRTASWRATASAEAFFSDQALVNTPLRTEYFKHLPGILTGLGIIGTFLGLIKGLHEFNASLDPNKVQSALGDLIHAVGTAFYVSATAITLAILFTGLEKLLVNECYKRVEEIQQAVDVLFRAGVGEEYLERLVKASESSATQSLHIKDALVADLRQILTEVTTQQVEASARDSGRISVDVGNVIAERLGGPMEKISAAVERVGATQGDAINNMLVDVLAAFSGKLEGMFGGQMTSMNTLLIETTQAMQKTADSFERLASGMDSAGKSAVDAMAERLGAAMTTIESRQEAMNSQMASFVEHIRELVSDSQTESQRKVQDNLSLLSEQVTSVVSQLQEQARQSAEHQGQQNEKLAQQTGAAVSGLSGQVEALLRQSTNINESLQGTVAQLARVTQESSGKMNSGAERLGIAATEFTRAGQGVSDTMKASGAAVEKIQIASRSLAEASAGAVEVLNDSKRIRESFALIVADLKTTFENAKREASMTTTLVDQLHKASQQLGLAGKQSEDYLKGINEVLAKVHKEFAENVEKTLRSGNASFQKELSEAVSLLSGAIQDLSDVLENVSAKR